MIYSQKTAMKPMNHYNRLSEVLDALGGMDGLTVMVNAKNFQINSDSVEFELGFDQRWLCTISPAFTYYTLRLRHLPLSSLSDTDSRTLCMDFGQLRNSFERTTKLSLDFH